MDSKEGKLRSNTVTSGDAQMYVSHYKNTHNQGPFEPRNSQLIGRPHQKQMVEVIENANYTYHPRHSCMLLMETSENMQAQLRDNTIEGRPKVVRQYNSINTDKHERGINKHGSVETLKDYMTKCG